MIFQISLQLTTQRQHKIFYTTSGRQGLVGTLIDIAKNENNMSIQDILDMKDRKIAGKTAPACGLFFLGPKYPDELQLNTCEENIFDRYKI